MRKFQILSAKYLLPLVVIACGISLWSLFSQSIRLDESQSIWVSTKPVNTVITLTSEDVHVPLYGVLLHFWMQLFGTSIVAARSLSFLFFLATLPIIYLFMKEASNRKIALLGLSLFTLSPFILWYTGEARMYTLFTLITSINHLFYLRMLRSNASNGKLGYFLSLIFGFYTHYFFLFLVATQILYTVFVAIKKYRNQQKLTLIWKTILLMLSAFVFFIPWIVLLLSHGTAANTQPLIPPPTSFNLIQTFVNFVFGFQSQGIQAVLVSLWPLAVMVLFFVFTKRTLVRVSGMTYMVLASFLPIALVFIASYFKPIFLSRYLIVVTPTLFFLLAWILTHYSKRAANVIITFVLFCMVGLMLFQVTSAATPVRENYEGASEYLDQHATPKDIIAVSAPFTVYPIEYSYQGTSRITTIPEWNRFTSGAIPPYTTAELDKRIKLYKNRYDKIFVVLSYDQGYEDKIKAYFDRYERLDEKTFSPNLEVRVYRLHY